MGMPANSIRKCFSETLRLVELKMIERKEERSDEIERARAIG
jgi:hypothetical protein